MPALMARAHEIGGAADGLTEHAAIDHLARSLMGAAEESVGRRADAQPFGARRLNQLLAFGKDDAERLFRIDVLARFDRAQANLNVRLGDGEVEDDVDRGIGKQGIQLHRLEAKLVGARLGSSRVHIGYGTNIEHRKILRCLEIGGRDIPQSDDANTHLIHV